MNIDSQKHFFRSFVKVHSFPFCLLFLFSVTISSNSVAQVWKPLFNGKDLSGWEVKNGTAQYKIEEDEIVGVSKLGTPNTFLCSNKNYQDFILELDVRIDPGLNSGIQIRSLSNKNFKEGRVHGYQIEIDPSERAWSGGIYDEARRGWLYPLSVNKEGRAAFRNGQWNHYRIEAIGRHIKTWINGVPCANLVDEETASGFIALQVHRIKSEAQEGLTVRWKNIRILTENVEAYQTPDARAREISWLKNALTHNEARKGWRLLWDGKTTNGWRGANDKQFPEKGWEIKDGILTVLESGGGESRNGGDIVSKQEFSEFELELDFMITEGANSGIKYFVEEGLKKSSGSAIGLEFQILDDERHPDAQQGVNGNRKVGSLYDLITAENLSEDNRSKKRFKGPNRWNKARLIVKDGWVEHWLNNIKVVEYSRGSQTYRNLVAKSKYNKYACFGEAPSGHILLQDHGNRVSFRNIKIREF